MNMGKKLMDYVPTLTQEDTNKVILYRWCSRKMARKMEEMDE